MSWRFNTLYGPSYGCTSAVRTLSTRKKTCEHELNSLWTNVGGFVCQAVCVGRSSLMTSRSCLAKSDSELGSAGVRNSPGIRSGAPNVISAADAPKSGLCAVRRPRRTSGSFFDHSIALFAINAALSVRCSRSIMPLACGWYAVVRRCVAPHMVLSSWKSCDSNCRPWSVVILSGTPYRATHSRTRHSAIVDAVISTVGTTSIQRENRSIMVRQ